MVFAFGAIPLHFTEVIVVVLAVGPYYFLKKTFIIDGKYHLLGWVWSYCYSVYVNVFCLAQQVNHTLALSINSAVHKHPQFRTLINSSFSCIICNFARQTKAQ